MNFTIPAEWARRLDQLVADDWSSLTVEVHPELADATPEDRVQFASIILTVVEGDGIRASPSQFADGPEDEQTWAFAWVAALALQRVPSGAYEALRKFVWFADPLTTDEPERLQ